jgi:hypothetical protein
VFLPTRPGAASSPNSLNGYGINATLISGQAVGKKDFGFNIALA